MVSSSRYLCSLVTTTSLLLVLCGCESESQTAVVPHQDETNTSPAVAPAVPEEGYFVGLGAISNDGNIDFVLQSNIPGTIEVMAGVDLKGQADSDVYIGNFERVRIVNGKGAHTLNTSELPSGDYLATVNFYPRWGFQDEISRSTGISQDLSGSQEISIGGSGESAEEVQLRENSQKWVMGNVISGYAWKETEWTGRFGEYEDLAVEGLNPDVISAYYFSKLDMTIFVNTLKGSVSHWRMGKANR